MTIEVHADPVNPMMGRIEGPAPAMQVGFDIVKRGAVVAPVLIMLGAVAGGSSGAASVAYALAIVLVNFWLSAALIGWASKVSFAAVAAAAMFGFLIRLGLITVAVLLVAEASWVNLVVLGVTLIVAHLGLLVWELKYVSASLAFPGLKPEKSKANTTKEKIQS